MKKVYISESKLSKLLIESEHYFCAGTDHPYFVDNDGTEYCADWNGGDICYPFGYWPIDYNGTEEFFIGDEGTTHVNACGKAAERYYNDFMSGEIDAEAYELSEAIEGFVDDFNQYGYTYNEEDDVWVSADGSDVKDVDDFVSEISDQIYDNYVYCESYVESFVRDFLSGNVKQAPSTREVCENLMSLMGTYYFDDKNNIDNALESIGSSFDSFFESGNSEGRIWVDLEMIGFYETEQPEPYVLESILRNLSNGLNIPLNELYGYHMVFEDWSNDGAITACTISDYISGNYGVNSDEEDDDEGEVQYARDGKTVFVPHLANQKDKREFFKDFRDTRDKALYVPRERGANTLAQYHAMRYPYGENKDNKNDNKLW